MSPVGMSEVLRNEWQWWIEQADVRDGLAQLPAGSVHMICTSPPYW